MLLYQYVWDNPSELKAQLIEQSPQQYNALKYAYLSPIKSCLIGTYVYLDQIGQKETVWSV